MPTTTPAIAAVLPPVITALLDSQGATQGSLTSGSATDDTTPTLEGTAQPDTVVQIYDNGIRIGEATVGTDWRWSFTPNTELSQGTHTFSVVGMYPDGSGATPAIYNYPITVNTTGTLPVVPVLPPVITHVQDAQGTLQGNVAPNGMTDDPRPTLSGTGEPGSLVSLYDNGLLLGTATVGADWAWSFQPEQALSDGAHSFSAVGSRLDGSGTTPATSTYTITTGVTQLPAVLAPVITGVDDHVGATQGALAEGAYTDDARPSLRGTGQPGTTVTLYDNGAEIGKVVVGANWQWSFTPAADLASGTHVLSAVGSYADGSGSTAAFYQHTIHVGSAPVQPLLPPVITEVLDNVGGTQGTLSANSTTDDNQPTLKGTSQPGTRVVLFDDGVKVGEALVGDNWQWSITPALPLSNGVHNLTVTASHPDGTGSTPAPRGIALTVESGALPQAPTVQLLDDLNQDGWMNQAEFNPRTSVEVVLPAQAQAGDLLTVIDNMGNIAGKVLAASDIQVGAVEILQFYPVISDGSTQIVTAKLTNAAGITSPVSTDNIKVDLNAPVAVSLQLTTDDNQDGYISDAELNAHNQLIDLLVTLDPTTQVGDQLLVTDQDGTLLSYTLTAQDVSAGRVTLSPAIATPVDRTAIDITVVQRDIAGNESTSTQIQVQMHTNAPVPVVFVAEDLNRDGTLTRTELGTATRLTVKVDLPSDTVIGDRVDLQDNQGNNLGHVITAEDIDAGQIIFAHAFPLPSPDTELVISATLTDTLGNLSPVVTDTVFFDGNHAPVAVDDSHTAQGIVTPVLTLDAMSKDTGSASGTPWFTSDGVAGRALYGQVSALLTPDMHIQVSSSDHPGVWQDAVLSSDGLHWSAVDRTSHQDSWAYSVRILNGNGQLVSTLQQSVGFNSTPATPTNPVIDLGTGQNATLDLSVNDVLSAGQTDKFLSNGKTQVLVQGDATDTVNLQHLLAQGGDTGTWSAAGTVDINGATYTVYNHTSLAAQVLVQQGVQITVPTDAGVAAARTAYQAITGNVLSNDTDVDGSTALLTVAGVHNTAQVVAEHGVDVSVEGLYGHLTLHADGSYSYIADKSSGLTSSAQDVFYYLNRDAVGAYAQAPAKLTIQVDPVLTGPLSTPLVLDLDGNGVQTLALDHGVTFDLHANGQPVQTGWVSAHDGLLVLDRNGDGRINDGSELFGDATTLVDGSRAQDGFQALADLDSNHDGVITHEDIDYSRLQVWVDANSDGMSQTGELLHLADLSIASIDLTATASSTVQTGNLLGLNARYTTQDGNTHHISDVWFATAGLEPNHASLEPLLTQAGLVTDEGVMVDNTPVATVPPTVYTQNLYAVPGTVIEHVF